jgi:hypothetical protein
MRSASIALMTAVTAFTGISVAQEKSIRLRQAPGVDKVEAHCSACHSLDYVQMNSPFLTAAGWDAEVTKMINAFGAPIDEGDAKTIVDYLNKNYGSESLHAVTARSAGSEPSSLEKEKSFPKPSSSNYERARQKYDTKRSGGTRVVVIPVKRTSLQNRDPSVCSALNRLIFGSLGSRCSRRPAPAFAWSARRRPLVLTTTEEFNLEGVLEHRSAVRWGAYRKKAMK